MPRPTKATGGAFPYQANIFYVRADGNDSADGLSLGNAWKTLGRAIKALRPGDTVYLEPGTYQADIDLQFHGETGKPISFRGRGINPVVIQGGLRVKDSSQVDFRRLNFSAEVKVDKSNGIAFDNCKWTAEGTALKAAGVSGLRLTHCVFTGFQEAAIALKSCSKTYLAGNLFDERGGVALRMDSADSIEYSNYNSYRQTVSGWEVAGEMLPFAEVQKKHERQ